MSHQKVMKNLFVLVPAAAEPEIGHGSAYIEDSSKVNGGVAGRGKMSACGASLSKR